LEDVPSALAQPNHARDVEMADDELLLGLTSSFP